MKKGLKVKMSESFKKSMLETESRDHILEFGDCVGEVIGKMFPNCPECNEWDVKWEPSGLRYGYSPDELTLVVDFATVHKTYHKFQKWLVKQFGNDLYGEWVVHKIKGNNGRVKTFKYRDYNDYELSKRLVGYDVICKVEKYVKRCCPDIKIAYCDDDVYCGSIILLIPHPAHGITVMFIPQLSMQQNKFFLYGNHLKSLLKGLDELKYVYNNDEL